MPVRTPTPHQILEIAARYRLALTDADVADYRQLIEQTLAAYLRLDELVEPTLPVSVPRSPGFRPDAKENPYNAWQWKTDITSGRQGLLSNKRVAIKDNICVAGVPMMNGSRLLEGFVPDIDATVVTRILEAGGTIAGKTSCEDLRFSGASHTCATGPIRNPHNPAHSAGGSSGGSAAAVAAGDVPMALGGDQGGSIRTPSSWCGVYGLKDALRRVDVLLMPTIPFTATEIPPPDAPRALSVDRALNMQAKYLPVRRHRQPGLYRPLRQNRRPSGRHDAGGSPFRRDNTDPPGPRIRNQQ